MDGAISKDRPSVPLERAETYKKTSQRRVTKENGGGELNLLGRRVVSDCYPMGGGVVARRSYGSRQILRTHRDCQPRVDTSHISFDLGGGVRLRL